VRIYGDHLVLIFQIHVDSPVAVGHSELGTSAQVDRAHSGSTLGIDHRGTVWIAIHHKNTFRRGIVEHAVGVLVSFSLASRLECFQIEDNYFSLAAIADESAAKLVRQGDAVVLLEPSDIAD
jgi:hypothetical protein